MVFITEAGELIKTGIIFIKQFGSSGSKPFIVEAGELIACSKKKTFVKFVLAPKLIGSTFG